jgi:hypothetical protein
MGFELGPKLFRNAPKGWLSARAFPERHAVASHHYGSEGAPEIETSMHLAVTWRVEVPGREPFSLREERSAPNWVDTGGIVGNGNRWYKLRVRPQFGLMKEIGVPCTVNPQDPSEIWIDWDRAFAEHEPVWGREARVRREADRRAGGIDAVLSRFGNPLVGKLRPEDEPYVERELARRRALERDVTTNVNHSNPVLDASHAEIKRRMDDLERIQRDGRKVSAVVVERVESGRKLGLMPVVDLVFELEGRRVPFEHTFGPRHAKPYVVGARVDVWIDPNDPDNLCPGR